MSTKQARNLALAVLTVAAVALEFHWSAEAGQNAKQSTIQARRASIQAQQPISGCSEFTNPAREPKDQPKLSVELIRKLYREPPSGVLWFKRDDSSLAIRLQPKENCSFSDIVISTDPQIPARPGLPVP